MNLARLALWPASLVAAGGTAVLVLTGDIADSPELMAAVGLVVGLSWCLTGLEEWRRRQARRIGPLMVFFGFAWFVSLWVYSSVAALYTTGQILRPLFIAVLAHVVLAFPSGRLEGLARAIVIAAYLNTTVLLAASVMFLEPDSGVRNLDLVESNAALSDAFRNLARGIGVALITASLVLLARRWRRAPPPPPAGGAP